MKFLILLCLLLNVIVSIQCVNMKANDPSLALSVMHTNYFNSHTGSWEGDIKIESWQEAHVMYTYLLFQQYKIDTNISVKITVENVYSKHANDDVFESMDTSMDVVWWAFAWATAGEVFSEFKYTQKAINIYNILLDDYYDFSTGYCGKGVWKDKSNANYKPVDANFMVLALTSKLYALTRDNSFQKAASDMIDFINEHHLISSGLTNLAFDTLQVSPGVCDVAYTENPKLISQSALLAGLGNALIYNGGLKTMNCNTKIKKKMNYHQKKLDHLPYEDKMIRKISKLINPKHTDDMSPCEMGANLKELIKLNLNQIRYQYVKEGILAQSCDATRCGADRASSKGFYIAETGKLLNLIGEQRSPMEEVIHTSANSLSKYVKYNSYGSVWYKQSTDFSPASQASAINLLVMAQVL